MAFSSGEYEMALPVEWTDKVCSYLEAEDLLNLSAANTFWRNAVNRNCIWKPLCVKDFNVNPAEKPIIDRKCRVEPAFQTLTNSCPNLSDICSWRIRYAQEIHVVNNWIQQRYAEEPSVAIEAYFGFILGNSLLFAYREGSTRKYAIWDLNNDTIAYYNEVDELYSFRNGFLACNKNIISYYALKEDVFELKIRTVRTKALHPEIPLLADNPSLQNYISTDLYRSKRNGRYFIIYDDSNSGTIVVWDFKNLHTFSFDLSCFFSPSAVVAKEQFDFWVGEHESSILFLQVSTLVNTVFILNIQNSSMILLHKHHIDNNFCAKIFGNSLALISSYEIHFLESNGSIRSVDCSNVETLINCRSFYCGLTYEELTDSYEVFLMDKESFSVQVIKRYERTEWLKLERYLECSSLDFVFVSRYEDGKFRRELINLKKLNLIELDEDFGTRAFESNKIISHGSEVLHFW